MMRDSGGARGQTAENSGGDLARAQATGRRAASDGVRVGMTAEGELGVKDHTTNSIHRHNVCILAYGQTGIGKTYTMEGTNGKLGIVPRAIQELFSHISQDSSSTYSFSISMLEVYMGSLGDFLFTKAASIQTHRMQYSVSHTSGSAIGVENPDDTMNRIARGMFGGYVNASVSADGNYSSPLDDDLAQF